MSTLWRLLPPVRLQSSCRHSFKFALFPKNASLYRGGYFSFSALNRILSKPLSVPLTRQVQISTSPSLHNLYQPHINLTSIKNHQNPIKPSKISKTSSRMSSLKPHNQAILTTFPPTQNHQFFQSKCSYSLRNKALRRTGIKFIKNQ